jgi:predicted lipoprotein with Yx(FWY)xxD motif
MARVPADVPLPATGADPVMVVDTRLADASGRSLYALEGNQDGKKCDAICEDAWPPVLVSADVEAVPHVLWGDLSTRTRPDGAMQLAFKGDPLYRYSGDGSVQSTSGDGVRDKWGSWHLVQVQQADAKAAGNQGGQQ